MRQSLPRHIVPRKPTLVLLPALVSIACLQPSHAATCATPFCTLDLDTTLWINNNTWGSENSPPGWSESITTNSLTSWRTDFVWPVAGNPQQDNAVKAYPSAVYGWHWGWSFPQANTKLPQQLGANYTATSTYNYTVDFGGGTGNVAYDLWLTDVADPGSSTQPTDEIMIWVNTSGGAGPCGAPTTSGIVLEGGTWTLSECQIPGYQYVWSFVRSTNSPSGTLNLKNFIDWLRTNKGLGSGKYLATVEFGSEIFRGTGNLNVLNYTCKVAPVVAGIIPDGAYRLTALHSGKVACVLNGSTADGASVVQQSYSGSSSQRWTFTHLGDNVYRIIGVQSGKALEIYGTTTANGTKAGIRTYSGLARQKWRISAAPTGGYYRLTPMHSTGSALDVNAASTSNGAKIQQWSWNGGRNQQWRIHAP
jgi:hypothetical protein